MNDDILDVTDTNNDISYLDRFIIAEVEKNPNVSYSGLFKRHRMKCPLIGQIIILNHIARILGQEGVRLSHSRAYQAVKYSTAYKDSMDSKVIIIKDILRKNWEEFENSDKKKKIDYGKGKHKRTPKNKSA